MFAQSHVIRRGPDLMRLTPVESGILGDGGIDDSEAGDDRLDADPAGNSGH